jgi:DNA mismatch repair protein MutS2
MAERLGLPGEVVRDARARLDDTQAQAEAVLRRLEQERAGLQQERESAAEERSSLEAERRQLKRAEQEAVAGRKAQAEAFLVELKKQGELAARRADEAIRGAVERVEAARKTTTAASRARGEVARAIRKAEREILEDPALGLGELCEQSEQSQEPITEGSRARVEGLGVVGEVLSLRDDDVELAVGGKRMRVPRAKLIGLGRPARPPSTPSLVRSEPGRPVPGEVNLVGLTVAEALPRVDKLLDDAALSDRRQLRLIHGFGQGRLRRAVAGLLEGHPHVARFRAGGAGEGGGGVTVVELKD